MYRIICLTAILLCSILLIGCANLGVDPWDRDLLARPDMEMISNPLETGLDAHIYFSKEASSGGEGFAGGGCGCN
jgi:hypothetical protein